MIKNSKLLVYGKDVKCKFCGEPVMWTKNKAGKSYLIDVYGYQGGDAVGLKTKFHRCGNR